MTAANAAGSATAASNTSAAITDFTASNFLGENFDGVTAPAIPATISADSGMDTSTAFANSNPNSLRLTGTTTAKWFETASAVGDAGGNDQLTFYARLSSGTGLEVVEASLAHSGTILGGAGMVPAPITGRCCNSVRGRQAPSINGRRERPSRSVTLSTITN